MIIKEKAYANYYGLNSYFEVLSHVKNKNLEQWVEDRKIETLLMTELIKTVIDNPAYDSKQIIEFADTFYVDDNTLYPSISESYSKDGVVANLFTPYANSSTINNLIITNIDKDNIYKVFDKIDKNIHLVKCFITEKDLPGIERYYRYWANKGITCIFAISGQNISFNKQKEETANRIIEEISKDKSLSYDIKESNDVKGTAKIYVIRKK